MSDFDKNVMGGFNPPNKLMVDTDGAQEDPSTVYLNEAKMEQLDLMQGDTIILVGRRKHKCIAIAQPKEEVSEGSIFVGAQIRKNLRVRVTDSIRILPAEDCPVLTRI